MFIFDLSPLREPLVTRDDLIGHDVNVAARVTDLAKGGDVVVTAALRDAAGQLGGVRFGRITARSIRGVAEPVRVCRAQWGECACIEGAPNPALDCPG